MRHYAVKAQVDAIEANIKRVKEIVNNPATGFKGFVIAAALLEEIAEQAQDASSEISED